MGRPERPINPSAPPPVRRIAMGLRVERHQAGLSYPRLAERAGYSAASLAAAASGESLPSRAVTTAYVAGCGADIDAWTTRWIEAHAELNGLSKPEPPTGEEGVAVFAERLSTLLRWKGLTSYDEVALATAGTLSRSTVYRVLSGGTVPQPKTLITLLSVALDTPLELQKWMTARLRLLGLPGSVEEAFMPSDSVASPDIATPAPVVPAETDKDVLVARVAERVRNPPESFTKMRGSSFRRLPFHGNGFDLRDELYILRKGAGVMRADLSPFPVLARLARNSGASELTQRQAIIALLTAAVNKLPEPMATVAAVMLNLPSAPAEMRRDLLQKRFAALGVQLDRDIRTVQRRADEANTLLLEILESGEVTVAEDSDA